MIYTPIVELTVGIPCYNCIETLEQTFQSINIQTVRPKEVILLDDYSAQHYSEIIKNFPKLKIRHIKQESNKGVGNARIRIVEECKTKYLTMIDSDDVFYRADVLQEFYEEIQKEPFDLLITDFYMQKEDQSLFIYENSSVGCHGKVYNVHKMREFNINFCPIRAHEEGYVNRFLLAKGKVRNIKKITYLWRWQTTGITRLHDPMYEYFEDYIFSMRRTSNKINYYEFVSMISLYNYWDQMRLKFGEKDEKVQKYKEAMFNKFDFDIDKLTNFIKNNKELYFINVKEHAMYRMVQKQNILEFIYENKYFVNKKIDISKL